VANRQGEEVNRQGEEANRQGVYRRPWHLYKIAEGDCLYSFAVNFSNRDPATYELGDTIKIGGSSYIFLGANVFSEKENKLLLVYVDLNFENAHFCEFNKVSPVGTKATDAVISQERVKGFVEIAKSSMAKTTVRGGATSGMSKKLATKAVKREPAPKKKPTRKVKQEGDRGKAKRNMKQDECLENEKKKKQKKDEEEESDEIEKPNKKKKKKEEEKSEENEKQKKKKKEEEESEENEKPNKKKKVMSRSNEKRESRTNDWSEEEAEKESRRDWESNGSNFEQKLEEIRQCTRARVNLETDRRRREEERNAEQRMANIYEEGDKEILKLYSKRNK
jgi:hypothetical protein